MKKILITNDDGIFAEGIQTLAKAFHAAGYEVLAVAPDRERLWPFDDYGQAAADQKDRE